MTHLRPPGGPGRSIAALGAALLVVDAHVTSHGALTLSGIVAMAIGLTTLFHDAGTPYHVHVWVVVTVTALIGGFWAFAVSKSVAARRAPVTVGPEQIVGLEGVVRQGGNVFVRGELWRASSDEPLHEGDRVTVDALDGLTLAVHRITP